MKDKIIKIDDIKFNNINFLKPITNGCDIIIPIYYKTQGENNYEQIKTPLLMQVPSLYLNDSYKGNSTINLPLIGKNDNLTNFIRDFFNNLDNIIYNNLKKILSDIKKKGLSPQINFSNISYKSIVNEIEGDDNQIYKNGLIRYKIYNSKNFSTKIYDDSKQLLTENQYVNEMVKGIFIKSIIEINSLIIRDNIIHVYIKPHQLRITPEKIDPISLNYYSFIDSDNEENEIYESDIVLNTQTDYLEPTSPLSIHPNFYGDKKSQQNKGEYYSTEIKEIDSSKNFQNQQNQQKNNFKELPKSGTNKINNSFDQQSETSNSDNDNNMFQSEVDAIDSINEINNLDGDDNLEDDNLEDDDVAKKYFETLMEKN